MGLHGTEGASRRAGEPAAPRDRASGTEAAVFGRYQLQGLLGRGGMGEVYRAYDTGRDRVVALKVLPPHLAGDADFIARFRRESRLAARLNNPHVVPIHDFGEVDGRLFLDMRLVEGTDLGALLGTRHRLEPGFAVHLVAQVASALDAAHRDGLVHRDVKPSNVLVTDEHHAYLTDFGIAHSTDATSLTGTGTALGTIHYMAPERFVHGRGDRRVDVYALGCVLHEVLTGRRPFDGDEITIQMYAHLQLPPPRPSTLVAGVSPALDEVVARAMAKDPEHRFDTAGALAAAARAALLSAATVPAGEPRPAATRHEPAPPFAAPVPPPVPPQRPSSPHGASGPPRDPWRRRALVAAGVAAVSFVAAAAAVGAVVLGNGAGGTGDTRAASPTSTRAAEPTPSPSALPSLAVPPLATAVGVPDGAGRSVRIGQAVRDGGIEATVTAARYVDAVEIGNDYSGYEAQPAGPDARYVVVEATVLNDTAKSISPGCGGGVSTAVLDDRSRRYDTIPELFQLRGNAAACFPAVQPGFSTKVIYAYKVPRSADVSRFVFEDQADFELPEADSSGVDLGLPRS